MFVVLFFFVVIGGCIMGVNCFSELLCDCNNGLFGERVFCDFCEEVGIDDMVVCLVYFGVFYWRVWVLLVYEDLIEEEMIDVVVVLVFEVM